MKFLIINAVLINLLLLLSCNKEKSDPDPSVYKGGILHKQPSIDIFPNATIYSTDSINDSLLAKKLTSEMSDIIKQQSIIGVSATLLIPNQGVW